MRRFRACERLQLFLDLLPLAEMARVMSTRIEKRAPDPARETIPMMLPYVLLAVSAIAVVGTWLWLEWGWAVVFEAGQLFCL